jgi:hypothetical protein
MLRSSEPSNTDKELLESWPELTNAAVYEIISKVDIIQNILLRNRKGGATRRDWFQAARILLRLSRKELIYLLLTLGQNEYPSIFPYALRFIKRKKTEQDKQRQKRLDAAEKKDKKIRDENRVVELVTKRRNETGESIENILIDISLPDRSKKSSVSEKSKTVSLSTNRKLYNAGIKRLRIQGYVRAEQLNYMRPPAFLAVEPSRRGRPKKDKK